MGKLILYWLEPVQAPFPLQLPQSMHIAGYSQEQETPETLNTAPISDKKKPCDCGCKGNKSKFNANTPASPEFNTRVAQETRELLEKAKVVQAQGRKQYNPQYAVTNSSSTLEVPPLAREIRAATKVPLTLHQSRLTNLVAILAANYFSPESGSFPTAIDWTSTVIATHLFNYSQQNQDHRYFSHLVSFYHKQNITGLLRQNYDDQLWVVLTFLRGAAYAGTCEPEWVDPFLQRASVFYDIARAGWDEETCGGGDGVGTMGAV